MQSLRKLAAQIPLPLSKLIVSFFVRALSKIISVNSLVTWAERNFGPPNPTLFPKNLLGGMSVGTDFPLSDGKSYLVAAHDEPRDVDYKKYRNLDEDLFQSVEIRRLMNLANFRNWPVKQGSWALPVMRTSSQTLGYITSRSGVEINANRFPLHRFVTLRLRGEDLAGLTLPNGIVAGVPLQLDSVPQEFSGQDTDVLVIFIDGLSKHFFSDRDFSELMPNTSSFFRHAKSYENSYSCAEWTLPSIASIFTGLEPAGHGLWHPSSSRELGANQKLLSEMFQENGYLTGMFGGNWRVSPRYGYARGFDRTLYRRLASAPWLIDKYIEHSKAFSQRKQFSWISFSEIHPPWPMKVPHLGLQSKFPPSLLNQTGPSSVKSPHEGHNEMKTEAYHHAIKELDSRLAPLFDFLETESDKKKMAVALVSDHGQQYLSEEKSVLKAARTEVPFMLKSPSSKASLEQGTIQSSDIPNLLCEMAGISQKNLRIQQNKLNFGGLDKPYSYSESIYPGQKYLARIWFDRDNWVEISSSKNVPEFGELDVGEISISQSQGLISSDMQRTILHGVRERLRSEAVRFYGRP
jgi:hypothetical protein